MTARAALTQPIVEPRGLGRVQAALYVGVGTTKFDEMVADGRMPSPKCIDSRKVWDRRELDAAFDDLPTSDTKTGWEAAHDED